MTDNISAEQLRQFIERIETLEEEKKGIADDIKDVYSEAKGTGFDTKIMKQIVRLPAWVWRHVAALEADIARRLAARSAGHLAPEPPEDQPDLIAGK
jgi:hypothetical protein